MNSEDSSPEIASEVENDTPEAESVSVVETTDKPLEQKTESPEVVVEQEVAPEVPDTPEILEAVEVSSIVEDPEGYLSRVDSSSLSESNKRLVLRDAVGRIYSSVSDADSRVHMERLKLLSVNESLGLDTKDWREAETEEIKSIKLKKSIAMAAMKILERDRKQVPKPRPKTETNEDEDASQDKKLKDLVKESAEQEKFSALKSSCAHLIDPLEGLCRIAYMRRGDGLPTFLSDAGPGRLRSAMDSLQNIGSVDTKEGREKIISNIQEAVRDLLGAFSEEEYFQERGIRDDLESLSFLSRKLRDVDETVRYFAGSIHKADIQELEDLAPMISGVLARIDNIEASVGRRRSAIERYLDRRY